MHTSGGSLLTLQLLLDLNLGQNPEVVNINEQRVNVNFDALGLAGIFLELELLTLLLSIG